MNEPAGDPFEALGDAHRREIVEMLRGGGRSVREIADALPISRPAVSRHLRLLKEAGLVTEQPQGTRRIYRLDDQGIEALENYITQVWGDTVMRFRMMAENTRSLSPLPGATPRPTPGRTASRSPRQVSSTKRKGSRMIDPLRLSFDIRASADARIRGMDDTPIKLVAQRSFRFGESGHRRRARTASRRPDFRTHTRRYGNRMG